jgi:hypothetical protein
LKQARVITAPQQDDVRVVVLGVALWPEHLTLYAMVESDDKEIREAFWEDDQPDMFGVTDDSGSGYERGGAAGSGLGDGHMWLYHIDFHPGVPAGVKTLTISHIAGSVELTL